MILITGGAGYVGSHVNKLLSQNGRATVVLDNLNRGFRDAVKWGSLIVADLNDKESLRRCFREHAVTAVMHFAGLICVGESVTDPQAYYHANVTGTLTLLSVMREFSVNKIVFSSTCAVYGNPQKIPLTEDHPLNPVSPYGRTKLMIEDVLRDYARAYGLKSVCLRYFNAAGADPEGELGERHDPETHLIPIAIGAALGKRGELQIYGDDYPTDDGTCIRDYIHVTDLAMAHTLALDYLNANGKSAAFNLGNGKGYSVKQVLTMVEKIIGKPIPVKVIPRREGDAPVLVGSSDKATRILGWQPRHARLEDIITSAWQWHTHTY